MAETQGLGTPLHGLAARFDVNANCPPWLLANGAVDMGSIEATLRGGETTVERYDEVLSFCIRAGGCRILHAVRRV